MNPVSVYLYSQAFLQQGLIAIGRQPGLIIAGLRGGQRRLLIETRALD